MAIYPCAHILTINGTKKTFANSAEFKKYLSDGGLDEVSKHISKKYNYADGKINDESIKQGDVFEYPSQSKTDTKPKLIKFVGFDERDKSVYSKQYEKGEGKIKTALFKYVDENGNEKLPQNKFDIQIDVKKLKDSGLRYSDIVTTKNEITASDFDGKTKKQRQELFQKISGFEDEYNSKLAGDEINSIVQIADDYGAEKEGKEMGETLADLDYAIVNGNDFKEADLLLKQLSSRRKLFDKAVKENPKEILDWAKSFDAPERKLIEDYVSENSPKQNPTTTEGQGAKNDKPIENVNGDVVNLKVSDIKTNPKEYQGRKNAFSKKSVEKIVSNYDKNKLDPIVVYKHPDGNTYVLSGHSRLEAMKQLGKEDVPARYFEGTPEQAKDFARKSNKLATLESELESAQYYKEQRESGRSKNSILEEAKENEQQGSANRVVNLSYLNPKGDAMNMLESFNETGDTKTQNRINEIAEKVGDMRSRFPEMSDAHENELFHYLMDTGDKVNKNDLANELNRKYNGLTDRIKGDEPLNLKKKTYISPTEQEWINKKAELENKIADLKTQVNPSKKTGWNQIKTDIIGKLIENEKLTPEEALKRFGEKDVQNLYNKKLEQAKAELKKAQDDLGKHLVKKDAVTSAIKNQGNIFDTINNSIQNNELTNEQADKFLAGESKIDKDETTIENLESKSKSEKETDLNEAVEQADKLIEGKTTIKDLEEDYKGITESTNSLFKETKGEDLDNAIGELEEQEGNFGKVTAKSLSADNPFRTEIENGTPLGKALTSEPSATIEALKDHKDRTDTAQRIRDKKSGGKLYSDPLFGLVGISEKIYNSALEFCAKQVEKGTSLGNAIAKTIKWVDEQMQGKKWNKGLLGKHLNDRYKITLPNGKEVEVQRDDTKQTAQVINGFYSPLEKGIIDSKLQSAKGKEWLKKLSGTTEGDEMKFTGTEQFLKDNAEKTLTKQDLHNFWRDNRIEIVEVVKGDSMNPTQYQKELDKLYAEQRQIEAEAKPYTDKGEDAPQELIDRNTEVGDKIDALKNKYYTKDTKFGQYQLEGEKSGYKEVLITMPKKEINISDFVDKNEDYIIEAYKKSGKLRVKCP